MYSTTCCNECHKRLTKEELSIYPAQWQYSGDMYCLQCRDCPDDCREVPCRLIDAEEEQSAGYDHLLFYDDLSFAETVLSAIKTTFDAEAEIHPLDAPGGHPYAILFTTEEEFSNEEASQLIRLLKPLEYDFNHESGKGEEDEDSEDEYQTERMCEVDDEEEDAETMLGKLLDKYYRS
jgi:hypothetical protein